VKKPYRPKDAVEIHRNMSAIRATENRTERALRSALHRLGLRYRKYTASLPGRPDIVFPVQKVAVFVDGDYWHARVLQEKGPRAFRATLRKKETQGYWLAKLRRNAERDRAATLALRKAGWLVVRLWESDAKRDVPKAAARIARTVRRR
jgi:DNA mismatch endonuclease (patch repair protein)